MNLGVEGGGGRRDVSGTAATKKKVLLYLLCCFRQVVLERFCVTDDICTFSLSVGAETEDMMMVTMIVMMQE